MPNWCRNGLTLSHTDTEKMTNLHNAMKDKKGLFQHLRPNPKGEESDDWYEWNNENWGTKWDVGENDNNNDYWNYDEDTDYFNFDTAWSPPSVLYNYLHENGWDITAYYEEEGQDECGEFSNGTWADYSGYNTGRRALRRFAETISNDMNGFIDINGLIENRDNDADDEDYESESEDEDEDEDLPITEASKIILKLTIENNKIYESANDIKNYWIQNVKDNTDKYDEQWYSLIATPKILKIINWKYILEELIKSKSIKKTRKLKK